DGGRPFCWKVSSDEGVVYVLGSVHCGKADMYPLAKPVEDAFERCMNLVVEADPEAVDPKVKQNTINEKGRYPAGDSISKHLTKDGLKVVKDFCERSGTPFEKLESLRTWMLTFHIVYYEADKLG